MLHVRRLLCAGRLFLENTVPKNIATSLKSDKFLDFFFRQLGYNAPRRRTGEVAFAEYPFLSPCGKEKNYIKCADVPIVFNTLRDGKLVYAASVEVRRAGMGSRAACCRNEICVCARIDRWQRRGWRCRLSSTQPSCACRLGGACITRRKARSSAGWDWCTRTLQASCVRTW